MTHFSNWVEHSLKSYSSESTSEFCCQNQAFSICSLSVPLKLLSDSNCSLGQMVEIHREMRDKAFGLKDS